MTSLASSRSSVRSIAFHYTSHCSLPPAVLAASVREESRSRNNSKINVHVPRFFKIPRGRVALHVYRGRRTDDCDGAAGDASNELHARDNADGGVGRVAGGKRALIRAGPESVYTAVRHDLTRK